jgi:hypothetical protein
MTMPSRVRCRAARWKPNDHTDDGDKNFIVDTHTSIQQQDRDKLFAYQSAKLVAGQPT